MFTEAYEEIFDSFCQFISYFPKVEKEYLRAAEELEGDLKVLFMKSVCQMTAADVISVPLKSMISHVKGVLRAVNTIDYCKKLDIDMIFDYILPFRINDEAFCLYNEVFYKELFPTVRSMSLREAAIFVNYESLAHATYEQADDRTQNALATSAYGKGRCGEESVLAVSMLRSVGIPARQVYSPFWSHCDDNHAWVEVFTGEKWEFLGACEPTDDLNYGWFNYAASKAGAVRYRVFGKSGTGTTEDENRVFVTELSTAMYGKTQRTEVFVTGDKVPLSRAKVGLYTVNYTQPKLILEKLTDESGKAVFETGLGDFIFFCQEEDKTDIAVCKNGAGQVRLELTEWEKSLEYELVPTVGIIPPVFKDTKEYRQKLMEKSLIRKAEHPYFEGENGLYYNQAGKNRFVIDEFLNCKQLRLCEKQEILATLTKKDFCDVSLDALLDMADTFKLKDKLPSEVFYKYLLPLRVKNEPLYPHRAFAREFFKDNLPKTPMEVYSYLLLNTKRLDSLAYKDLVPDLKGVLKYSILTSESFDIIFVQLCRALGYAARLSPIDETAEYFDGFGFVPLFCESEKECRLNIYNKSQKALLYNDDFTVSIVENGHFKKLEFESGADDVKSYMVKKGMYAVTYGERQIDGSIIGKIQFVNCERDRVGEIFLHTIKDKTAEKLLCVPVPYDICDKNGRIILAYIENGFEPTEHLLNEIAENACDIENNNIKIILYCKDEGQNSLLREVALKPFVQIRKMDFCRTWENLRREMCQGDARLPFVLAVNDHKGLYSFANYSVGNVQLLIKILKAV